MYKYVIIYYYLRIILFVAFTICETRGSEYFSFLTVVKFLDKTNNRVINSSEFFIIFLLFNYLSIALPLRSGCRLTRILRISRRSTSSQSNSLVDYLYYCSAHTKCFAFPKFARVENDQLNQTHFDKKKIEQFCAFCATCISTLSDFGFK